MDTKVLSKNGRPKPPAAGKGRPKGTPNKNTKALKDMILAALDGVGGIEYLKKQAEDNPGPFMSLVGKVLPMTIQGGGEGEPPISIRVEFPPK